MPKMPISHLEDELRLLPMFQALEDEQLTNLIRKSNSINLKKDQTLFTMGEPSSHFYYLKSGQIKISRASQHGLEKVLTIINPGQLFAEAVMFLDKGQYPATSTALESAEVIGFKNQIFTQYLQESNALSMAMLSNLTTKLHKQIIEIDNLTMQNANFRLVNFIDKLIPKGRTGAVEVELPGPKSTIASRLSVTPETLSRALHTLTAKNIISSRGKSRLIEIPDIEKFRQHLHSL